MPRPGSGTDTSKVPFVKAGSGRASTEKRLREAVLRGFPFEALEAVSNRTNGSPLGVANALAMSHRALNRRKVEGRLTRGESERLVRLARILVLGRKALGSFSATWLWLGRPQADMRGGRALDLIVSDVDWKQLEQGLIRLIFGGYS